MASAVPAGFKGWFEKMKTTKGFKAWEKAGIPMLPGMAPPITLYYHSGCRSFTGRATPMMMFLDNNDIPYTCETPDAYTGSVAFAPPFAKIGGVTIGQTSGILIALAETLKLAPEDAVVRAKTFQVAMDAADMLVEGSGGKWSDDTERAAKWLAHVEKLIADGGLNGDAPGISDFAMINVRSPCAVMCA